MEVNQEAPEQDVQLAAFYLYRSVLSALLEITSLRPRASMLLNRSEFWLLNQNLNEKVHIIREEIKAEFKSLGDSIRALPSAPAGQLPALPPAPADQLAEPWGEKEELSSQDDGSRSTVSVTDPPTSGVTSLGPSKNKHGAPRLTPGATLWNDKIILEEEIGEGGFAKVWRCRLVGSREPVIARIAQPEVSKDPTALARFQRGARIAATFNHPNIMDVLEPAGEENGLFFTVSRYIDGPSLHYAVLNNSIMITRDKYIGTLWAISNGVAALHRRGFVHGDLKPHNIILDWNGTPKIIDFDATLMTFDYDILTAPRLIGTPRYMAPEIVAQIEKRTFRNDAFTADVYALGLIGTFMFAPLEFDRYMYEEVALLEKTDIPETLRKTLSKALRHDPDERFLNAEHFAAALRKSSEPDAPLSYQNSSTLTLVISGHSESDSFQSIRSRILSMLTNENIKARVFVGDEDS